MTTDTERRPEHPGWRPWWIRYAEYEGIPVRLSDSRRNPFPCSYMRDGRPVTPPARFIVGKGFPSRRATCPCDTLHLRVIFASDDLTEAEAAFEQAAQQLAEER